ncbi:conserved hypothetical protein [Bradyrhizobium sp. STM 3843]|uniref:DUF3291 domain-containing protein n=1 Tax=Bradyrhizobium sp. STM 3843 TaxID=551947 RepID=UPI0002403656|nr:DUF3291 domain-containing protein [Bradyrhizobium sp. STM 3843]CCE07763.1 conserved hypothetical protein [Bradyrhizobium sp. STM 3843]
MSRIALYTFGILNAAAKSDELADFRAVAPAVYGEAERSEGFIAHAVSARPDLYGKSRLGQDFGPWGVYVAPRFYQPSGGDDDGTMIATLSLWQDTDAAWSFVYGGLHRGALRRRRDWFKPPEWPGYVLWWVPHSIVPTWREGASKLEALHDDGPRASGFDFSHRYDADGQPDLPPMLAVRSA